MRRVRFMLALALSVAASGGVAWADDREGREAEPVEMPQGHPKVTLDRLDLSHAPLATADEKFLRDTLGREARKVDWGAGRASKIQYRFRLEDLTVTETSGLLQVKCTAVGWLPKGRPAKSHLTFGGSPSERGALVHRVLEIVSRGVLTRLAEIERHRRHVDP